MGEDFMGKKKKDSLIKERKEKNKIGNKIKCIFTIDGKIDFIALVKNILIPLGGGLLIAFITKSSIDIYGQLKKPSFAPPSYLFGIVWTILYIAMGIAAYRIYMRNKSGKDDKGAYFIYLLQLALNFLWPIIFFNLRLYGVSFILIVIILIMVIITTIKFYKIDKLSGFLLIPYILWVSYASILTYFIWMFNEM